MTFLYTCFITHRWSSPLYSGQVRRLQDSLSDGISVRWKHLVDEPHPSDGAVLSQLLVVLVEEPLRVGDNAVTIFPVTRADDVHAHTRGRHCCSVSELGIKIFRNIHVNRYSLCSFELFQHNIPLLYYHYEPFGDSPKHVNHMCI